jgi:hypothetical protein
MLLPSEPEKIRDRKLRRMLLQQLHYVTRTAPSGDVGGETLRDYVSGQIRDPQQNFESEAHALALMRDLVNKQLASETKTTRYRGETFGLRHLRFAITAKGSSLYMGTEPVDADIDDDRVLE